MKGAEHGPTGTVILDGEGNAIVQLPDWFEALNRDFRYQLTCIGEAAPVYVAEEIAGNRFRIVSVTPYASGCSSRPRSLRTAGSSPSNRRARRSTR